MFQQHIQKLHNYMSVRELLPVAPTFKFRPDFIHCTFCGKKLMVYSTQPNRQVITLHVGEFIAHNTLLSCDCQSKPVIFHSEKLDSLVPKYSNFGYDVIEFIGRSVFQRFKTENEVVEELADLNISISSSEVGYLAKKFIIYLSVLHKNNSDKIKESMQKKGGYILHIDGTTEGGSPHLITAIDEISQFVLANTKIPTENADDIADKLLHNVKKRFGNPIAVVADLGKAMLGAIGKVFQGILIFVCHFHFLRDIGKDLLNESYDKIRKTLKIYGISTKLKYRLNYYLKCIENIETSFEQLIQVEQEAKPLDKSQLSTICYTLIQWTFDAKKQGNGFGFPFDTTHSDFYLRLCILYDTIKNIEKNMEDKIEKNMEDKIGKNIQVLRYLLKDLQPLIDDKILKETYDDFKQKKLIFEELREAMRIANPKSKEGLNDNGENQDMKTIEQDVINFKNHLINNPVYKDNTGYYKMIEQIDKYWDKLFADPILVKTPKGEMWIQPQRTNNILEQFFRDFKSDHRRRSGNNSITKKLQTMFADTTFVKNLDNQNYMNIILDGKKSLAECFATIEYKVIQEAFREASQYEDKIPAKMKKHIKNENINNLFPNLKLTT